MITIQNYHELDEKSEDNQEQGMQQDQDKMSTLRQQSQDDRKVEKLRSQGGKCVLTDGGDVTSSKEM